MEANKQRGRLEHLLQAVDQDPIIDTDLAKGIITHARRECYALIEQYAPGRLDKRGNPVEIPEHIQDKLRRVFRARDSGAARDIAQKAVADCAMHLLALWANKRVCGPQTERNLESQAAAAEDLAAMFEKRGEHEKAQEQRARAATLRYEAAMMTADLFQKPDCV